MCNTGPNLNGIAENLSLPIELSAEALEEVAGGGLFCGNGIVIRGDRGQPVGIYDEEGGACYPL